jgi:hypothetical protein
LLRVLLVAEDQDRGEADTGGAANTVAHPTSAGGRGTVWKPGGDSAYWSRPARNLVGVILYQLLQRAEISLGGELAGQKVPEPPLGRGRGQEQGEGSREQQLQLADEFFATAEAPTRMLLSRVVRLIAGGASLSPPAAPAGGPGSDSNRGSEHGHGGIRRVKGGLVTERHPPPELAAWQLLFEQTHAALANESRSGAGWHGTAGLGAARVEAAAMVTPDSEEELGALPRYSRGGDTYELAAQPASCAALHSSKL